MKGKVTVKSSGYDPDGPRVNDPTLGPGAKPAEAKHTPGPWRVDASLGHGRPVIYGPLAGRDQALATVHAECVRGNAAQLTPHTAAEAEANAHLVAAAPELLAVAVAVLELIGRDGELNWRTADLGPVDLRRLAAETVKKATGR